MNRTFIVVLLWVSLVISGFSQNVSYPDFEIVESVPIETNLDNPDIRNAHEVWLEMINGAKTSLDIEEFYISPQEGEPLDDILDAINAANKRGIKVRLLIDARMYKTYPEVVDNFKREELKMNNLPKVQARVIDFGKLAGGVQHAKYFIVDNEQVFLGSQNFDWRALKHIHELGVRIKNNIIVSFYANIFELDWNLSKQNDPAEIQNYLRPMSYAVPFRVIEAKDDTLTLFPTASPESLIADTALWDETNIVELIDGAKYEVMCQFLSYSPSSRDKSMYTILDDALRRAAKRGVKVKMIVSDWGKATEAEKYLKDLSQVPNIEVKFSDIPEWSGGYVSFARVEHCKYLVIDSAKCWLGTANWEKSYFYYTRNVGIVAWNKKITNILRNIFLKSWNGPYTELIKPEIEYKARRHEEK